jgi:hypothetical protein
MLSASSNFGSRMSIRAYEMASRLLSQAGSGYQATTWIDENRALFRALRLEYLVTALFIGLITFVAGLNILVVLAMTVSESCAGYRGTYGDGCSPQTDQDDFHPARFSNRCFWNGRGTHRRLRTRLDCGPLPTYTARPTSIFCSIRAVSSERK